MYDICSQTKPLLLFENIHGSSEATRSGWPAHLTKCVQVNQLKQYVYWEAYTVKLWLIIMLVEEFSKGSKRANSRYLETKSKNNFKI